MKRISVAPRPNWQDEMQRIGFDYHSIDGNYWQEDACYVFSEAQIDEIERVTEELHQMYFIATRHIVQTGDYARLGINDLAASLIESSFEAQTPTLYGRFDLCYDGTNAPKLYEYNADTPTSLFEGSVAQWYWLQSRCNEFGNSDQFNSIHERLLVEFKALKSTHPLYFTAVANNEEDYITTRYLQDVAIQAGIDTHFIDIHDIGYRTSDGKFVDLHDVPIHQLFKLYPWEWLVEEDFGKHILDSNTQFIEPAYKLLFSNKALLAVLWALFPNHPNLLPAYLDHDKIHSNFVKKPFFSREGANISLHTSTGVESTDGIYGKEGYVYQQAHPLPTFVNAKGQTMHTLIGSWVIGHGAAGIGVREDYTAITKDTSLFVPHIFR